MSTAKSSWHFKACFDYSAIPFIITNDGCDECFYTDTHDTANIINPDRK